MPVRILVAEDAAALVNQANKLGLDVGAFNVGINESGRYYFLYDTTEGESVIQPADGRIGFSYGAGGVGTVEMLRKFTAVPTEVVSAIGGLNVTGTLVSTYVLPGTVTLTDTGGNGPTMVDDRLGNLVEEGTTKKRGTIDYGSGAIDITYVYGKNGSGNLEAAYEHSDIPDSSNVPDRVFFKSISLLAASNVAVEIYEDEALTVPVFKGTVTVTGGSGFLDLGRIVSSITEVDLTKRNRRWIVIDTAGTDMRLYWERATS